MSRAGTGEGEWDGRISTVDVNSLSVSLYLRTFSSPGEFSLLWQKSDRDLKGITAVFLFLSLFPTRTDRSQIHNNRAYFNTFSVGTQDWLKINILSIASRSLSFLESLSFWVCFAVVAALVVLHCSGGFSSFFFLFLSSILWRSRNAFLGAVSDMAQSSPFSFII